VLKIINSLPTTYYKLLDIGAREKELKNVLPKNIQYFSLDIVGKQDYICDLEKEKIPVKKESFDIVICLETLEHISNPYKAMKEILRIAKKDALFIMSMPNEYNFILRFYYLIGKKTDMQKPFKIVSKHLHIHTPRVKDILSFFSEYIKIEEKYYYWQSQASKTNNLAYSVDKLINQLAKIYPSLFSRIVVIKGKRK